MSFQRMYSVSRKEVLHILRDPMTLFMTLFFPVVELFMLGYAIETKVTDIMTVVFDQARTQESGALLREFENSGDFKIVEMVQTDEALQEAIVAGRARVGIKIPEDYSRRIEAGQTAQVLVLVDGTVSSVAAEAVNVGAAIGLRESLSRMIGSRSSGSSVPPLMNSQSGDSGLLVDVRPQVLFNPNMTSANFFIPGLMVVLCQMMSVTLSANAIVREKEKGTLEQLFMTPVKPGELILGKMAPYLVMTFCEFCGIAFLMWAVFGVPIHGRFATLLMITLPFVLSMLGWGLWISTKVSTRDAAMQAAMATLMPCIFLSGYVFPLDSMPRFFWWVAQLIPTTWLIDASRGVILRGAGWRELWMHSVVLWGMTLVIVTYTALRFRKRVT
ncbi:MAG TPA: ABC transporter permease [Gemmataceae bacterium]|nr:ABC transporter permease [Gemmataceae bacterium]